MPLRLAEKESSGTDTYSRGKADWNEIEGRLREYVNAATALVLNESSFETGAIFQLTTPLDRFTGAG